MNHQDPHESFMRRCLELAAKGAFHTAPNPMVGSVVVHEGCIIGEGYHQRCGEAHAEVNAIARVQDPSLLPNSTLYVNLEPCSHHGKTPPCADLIIEKGLARVVVSNVDPHHRVGGKGIQRLEAAGVEVITGVLASEGRWLNRKFFAFHEQQRPYITLKWAQSSDGFIDRIRNADTPAAAITGPKANVESHRWRATHQAILVGANTAIMDQPSLTTRLVDGQNPLRILLDPNLRVPSETPMLSVALPTLVINQKQSAQRGAVEHLNIGAEPMLPALLAALHERGIISLLVEGGTKTHQAFLESGLWDEIRQWTSPDSLGSGVPAPAATGQLKNECTIGADTLRIFVNQ